MKKIMFFILLVAFQNLEAQKCEPIRSKTDPITDEKIEAWGWKIGWLNTMEKNKECNIRFLVIQDPNDENRIFSVLEITHQVASSRMINLDPIFEEGKEYFLKTENSILKLPATQVKKTNNNHLGIYYVTNQLIGTISKEDVAKLANEDLLFYQALSSNGYSVEGKVSKKNVRKMKEQMNCFLTKI
tara:strand:+ start:3150 stop:3707 length:558 start_codon:yes stop_codon:yes gene_type:complete